MTEQRQALQGVLSTLESSLPVDMLFADAASRPEALDKPALSREQFEMMLDAYIQFWGRDEKLDTEMLAELCATDPFFSDVELTKALLIEKGAIDNESA